MRAPSRTERIAAQLADLKMPGVREALDGLLAGVDRGQTTAAEAIEWLLATQIALRNGRRLEAAMRSSRLPYVTTVAGFDFTFQPSIKREHIDALHDSASWNGRRTSYSSVRPAPARRTWPSARRSRPPRTGARSTSAP